MKYFFLCALALLMLPGGLRAQKGELPDRVTFADGTVEPAQVQRSPVLGLGKAARIKRKGENLFRSYSPETVTEYTLGRNQRTYRSVDVDLPSYRHGGARIPQKRFGEVLVDGDVQLIKINLDVDEYEPAAIGIEPYMYLLREDEVEISLELSTIMVYELLNANPSRFRNNLKFFARGCPEALRFAEKAQFRDGDIMRVVSDYSNCKSLGNVSLNENRISGRLTLSHYLRGSVIDIRDQNYNDRQLSLGIGYQGEAGFTNQMRWLGVLLSAEYVYQSFRWEDRTNVQQSMVKSNLSMVFKPVQREFFEIQLTGGLSSYNATSSSFRSFFNNNYFLLSTGIRMRSHRYLFGLAYEKMPNPIRERPGNMMIFSAGYQLF